MNNSPPLQPNDSGPPNLPRKRRRFKFTLINLGVIAAGAIYWAIYNYWLINSRGNPQGIESVGQRISSFFAACISGGIVSLLGFFLSGRSRLVATVVFGICLGYALHLQSVKYYNDATMAKIRNSMNRIDREYAATGTTSGTKDAIEEIAKTLENDYAGGGTRTTERLITARVLREVQSAASDMASHINAISKLGNGNIAAVDSRDELTSRIRFLDETSSVTAKYLSFYEGLPSEVEQMARTKGLPESNAKRFSAAIAQQLRIPEQHAYKMQQIDFCQETAAYLRFLEKQWPQWTFEASEKRIVFNPQTPRDILQKCNDQASSMTRSARKLNILQKAWFEGAGK